MGKLPTLLVLGVLGMAAASQAVAADRRPEESFCSTLSKGASRFVVDSQLHVMDQTAADGSFRYVSRSGAPTIAVMCRRASALPLANDRKVVDAGYAFFVQTPTSVTAVEKADGRYALRVVRGRLSSAERALILPTLRSLNR